MSEEVQVNIGVNPETQKLEPIKSQKADCAYFITSSCAKAASCAYRHSDVAKTSPLCRFWMSGNCATGNGCKFQHPSGLGLTLVSQMNQPFPQPQISQFSVGKSNTACYYFSNGQCLKGNSCLFLHKPPELPQQDAAVPKQEMASVAPSPSFNTSSSNGASFVPQNSPKILKYNSDENQSATTVYIQSSSQSNLPANLPAVINFDVPKTRSWEEGELEEEDAPSNGSHTVPKVRFGRPRKDSPESQSRHHSSRPRSTVLHASGSFSSLDRSERRSSVRECDKTSQHDRVPYHSVKTSLHSPRSPQLKQPSKRDGRLDHQRGFILHQHTNREDCFDLDKKYSPLNPQSKNYRSSRDVKNGPGPPLQKKCPPITKKDKNIDFKVLSFEEIMENKKGKGALQIASASKDQKKDFQVLTFEEVMQKKKEDSLREQVKKSTSLKRPVSLSTTNTNECQTLRPPIKQPRNGSQGSVQNPTEDQKQNHLLHNNSPSEENRLQSIENHAPDLKSHTSADLDSELAEFEELLQKI